MRAEYPRPDFVREEWQSLNGTWDFYYGDHRKTIEVPYVCQSDMSGIGETIWEERVVYERTFSVPESWDKKRILLHFGAVDYKCRVWINGSYAGGHVGGQTPFTLDITGLLKGGEETIRVEAQDPPFDERIPRGKQFWEKEPKFIWYTLSTGIWQSVWLEPVERTAFERVHFTPDIDSGTVKIDYMLREGSSLPCKVRIDLTFQGKMVFSGSIFCDETSGSITVDVFKKKAMAGAFHFTGNYWSPEHPNLYDADLSVEYDGVVTDRVKSYFGMRKIHVVDGRIWLNNQPYYQKLLLDQGYWKESLITAPDDNAYKEDIEKAKRMGFNGCRKHEKAEDPQFLYWADRLGFLVWGAMASFWAYTADGAAAFMREWQDMILRDYNHPSVIVWGMLNESWGVPEIYVDRQQQSFAQSLYYMAKSMDSTRLVISNDGWEMTDSDICAFHSYRHGERDNKERQEVFSQALKDIGRLPQIMARPLFAKGYSYCGQPVVLTECGGISVTDTAGWGYTCVEKESFIREYERIMEAVDGSDLLCGFCYTQLTDVQQETNGLLTDRHEYKADPDEIRRINDRIGRRIF